MTAKRKTTLHSAEEVVRDLLDEADDPTLRHPAYRNYIGGLQNAAQFLRGAREALEETDALEGAGENAMTHNEKQGARGDHESSGDGADLGERTKPEPRGRNSMDPLEQAVFEGANEKGFSNENKAELRKQRAADEEE